MSYKYPYAMRGEAQRSSLLAHDAHDARTARERVTPRGYGNSLEFARPVRWLARTLCVGLLFAASGCPLIAGLDDLPVASDAAAAGEDPIDSGVLADTSARDGASVRPPTVCDVEPSWGPARVVGNPSWQTAELAVFGAPIGATSNDIFTQTTNAVFGPNHAYDPLSNVTRAVAAHEGPYDRELAAGIQRAGFKSTGCLRLSALAAPNGFAIAMNLVPSPTAPVKKSFEAPTLGPVVSFGALNIAADLYIDGVLVDYDLDNEFPSAAEVYFDPTIEGYAHLFLIFSESTAYAPLTVGLYRFDVSLDDGVGNRTFNSLTFKVVD